MSNFDYTCPHCLIVQDTVIFGSEDIVRLFTTKLFSFPTETPIDDDIEIVETQEVLKDWVQCPNCNKKIEGKLRDTIREEHRLVI